MRGKNIIWLSWVALLLSVMLADVGAAPPAPVGPVISITPTGTMPGPGELIHPGEIYPVTVSISNVADLWSAQIEVKYAPFLAVFSSQDYTEGPFLAEGWTEYPTKGTHFYPVVNHVAGTVTFVMTRYAWPGIEEVGASGSGLLATFNLLVIESGNSGLELGDCILLDSTGSPIAHTTSGSAEFWGSTAWLIRMNMPDGRNPRVGDTFPISAKVRNDGDLPLHVRVLTSLKRVEDGRQIELFAGQTYYGGYIGAPPPMTILECDGWYYDAWAQFILHDWWGATDLWDAYGDAPYLDAIGDGNLINSTTPWEVHGLYTFEDITLPWEGYTVISNVDLWGYTIGGDDNHDIDPFVLSYDEGGLCYVAWCDSMGTGPTWRVSGSKYGGGAYPEAYGDYILTEQGINNAEVFVEYFIAIPPDGQLMGIDALWWTVEFATIVPVIPPVYEIAPGEELELDDILWITTIDHVGTYELTATIQYSSELSHWNSMGTTQKTLTFTIKP